MVQKKYENSHESTKYAIVYYELDICEIHKQKWREKIIQI